MEKILKWLLFLILVVIIITFVILGIYAYSLLKPAKIVEVKGINLTQEEFGSYLEGHFLVEEMPEDGKVQITLGENYYSLSKDSVKEENIDNPDIEIVIPEEYIGEIGMKGLCAVMGPKLDSGEFQIFFGDLSETELTSKYLNLLRYRKCFGNLGEDDEE
jgi:hypothetical protein|tara:strand:+ start:67 stop:546 length:480 start_codon:yes stop_codon:yes gene_type:complete